MDIYIEELKKLHEIYRSGEYSKLGISIALGVDRRTVRRWFQDKHPPTKKHQKKIKNLVQNLKKNISNHEA